MKHPIVDPDAEPLDRAGIELEHGFHRLRGLQWLKRHRPCVAGDRDDSAVCGNKQHVEGEERVLHPHAGNDFGFEDKQHPDLRIQPAASLQSLPALVAGFSQFNLKMMRSGAGPDDEGADGERRRFTRCGPALHARKGAGGDAAEKPLQKGSTGRQQPLAVPLPLVLRSSNTTARFTSSQSGTIDGTWERINLCRAEAFGAR